MYLLSRRCRGGRRVIGPLLRGVIPGFGLPLMPFSHRQVFSLLPLAEVPLPLAFPRLPFLTLLLLRDGGMRGGGGGCGGSARWTAGMTVVAGGRMSRQRPVRPRRRYLHESAPSSHRGRLHVPLRDIRYLLQSILPIIFVAYRLTIHRRYDLRRTFFLHISHFILMIQSTRLLSENLKGITQILIEKKNDNIILRLSTMLLLILFFLINLIISTVREFKARIKGSRFYNCDFFLYHNMK